MSFVTSLAVLLFPRKRRDCIVIRFQASAKRRKNVLFLVLRICGLRVAKIGAMLGLGCEHMAEFEEGI